MGKEEVSGSWIVQAVLKGMITNEECLMLRNVPERRFRRLKARHRKGGLGALEHELRRKRSNRRLNAEVRCNVIAAPKGAHAGLIDTRLAEEDLASNRSRRIWAGSEMRPA